MIEACLETLLHIIYINTYIISYYIITKSNLLHLNLMRILRWYPSSSRHHLSWRCSYWDQKLLEICLKHDYSSPCTVTSEKHTRSTLGNIISRRFSRRSFDVAFQRSISCRHLLKNFIVEIRILLSKFFHFFRSFRLNFGTNWYHLGVVIFTILNS